MYVSFFKNMIWTFNYFLAKQKVVFYKYVLFETINDVADHSVETAPAPAGGPILLLLLNMMESYFSEQYQNNSEPVNKNVSAHRLLEVSGNRTN